MSEHEGHRQRILQKLDTGLLEEHELLEVLLFNALPRRNTNDIAHRLLSTFGSIKGVFSASMEQLSKVKGVGQSAAAYLICIGKFYEKYYDPNTTVFPDRFDKETFIPFVKGKYAPLKEEVLDIYLLSSVGKITHCRRFTIEQEDQVEILPTDFTKLISEYKPSGMVIVHNHPKGSCLPSKADDETTKKIQLICSFHNVLLCDHFIYSPTGVYSYYETGKMQEITQNCSLFNVLSGIRE